MSYGHLFIEALKAESLYGEIFSYQEYQAIKKSETIEEFKAFWATTQYKSIPIYQNPKFIVTHIQLQKEKNACFSWLGSIGEMDNLAWLLIPFIPFLLIWSFARYHNVKRKIKKLG